MTYWCFLLYPLRGPCLVYNNFTCDYNIWLWKGYPLWQISPSSRWQCQFWQDHPLHIIRTLCLPASLFRPVRYLYTVPWWPIGYQRVSWCPRLGHACSITFLLQSYPRYHFIQFGAIKRISTTTRASTFFFFCEMFKPELIGIS